MGGVGGTPRGFNGRPAGPLFFKSPKRNPAEARLP
jgi:hypothetical protein